MCIKNWCPFKMPEQKHILSKSTHGTINYALGQDVFGHLITSYFHNKKEEKTLEDWSYRIVHVTMKTLLNALSVLWSIIYSTNYAII